MTGYIAPLAKLIEHLRALPGVGGKTAVRLAYHLLDMDAGQAQALADAIVEAKAKIAFCAVCYNLTDRDPCAICADESRDRATVCVVEQPRDVMALERTHDYRGLYHVLHGALSPMDGIGPDDLRVKELLTRCAAKDETGAPVVREVIMATNASLEGEATALYVAKLLQPLGVKVTRLAHGLPVGGDLEYADEMTLAKALANRVEI